MSSIPDNDNSIVDTSLLIFSDNLNDIVLLQDEINDQDMNFNITLSTQKDELHDILSLKQHDFLIFLDTKREINLNAIEVFVKGVNPDITLIFLDYLYDQIIDEENSNILGTLVTKILTWINILKKIKVEDDFFSIKLSSKNVSEIEKISEPVEFNENPDNISVKELQNALKRMNTIFDAVPEGIVVLNMRGYISRVNKAYGELTGYTPDDLYGKHILQIGLIKKEDILKYGRVLTAMLRGRPVESFEFRGYMKDGAERIGETRSRLVNLGLFQKEIVIITHDVTDRHNREMKLRDTLKDLAQTNLELDDYTYAVSHDLKAPLRTIKSFGTFLLEDYSDGIDEEGRMYLRRMMEATTHMKDLIEDLLTLSRVGRMDIEDEFVNVNEIIDLIRTDLSSQLDDTGGEIFATNMPTMKIQRIWIRQLLFNLISNGLKFTKSETPKAWVNCYESPIEYSFSVRDNGIGIEEKYQDKIFKIFERLHKPEEYSGTGAGLTICKKIVGTLGGKIWIESKLGMGSTFFFTIPKLTYDPLAAKFSDAFTAAEIPNGDM